MAGSVYRFKSGGVKTSLGLAGFSQIRGKLSRLGIGGPYYAVLFNRPTSMPLEHTYSDVAGNYSFQRVSSSGRFFVIAFDHTSPDQLKMTGSDKLLFEPTP